MVELRGTDLMSLFFGVLFGTAGLFFLVFAVLGLRNVLRFKR
jgi:hypothetical protein